MKTATRHSEWLYKLLSYAKTNRISSNELHGIRIIEYYFFLYKYNKNNFSGTHILRRTLSGCTQQTQTRINKVTLFAPAPSVLIFLFFVSLLTIQDPAGETQGHPCDVKLCSFPITAHNKVSQQSIYFVFYAFNGNATIKGTFSPG